MCGRFSIISNAKDIAEHYGLAETGEYLKSYNVTPSNNIAVIRLKENRRELSSCHWGLIPRWYKSGHRFSAINAKAETIDTKPYFREAFKKRRCLIPANGYYEWKGPKGQKQPYYFRLKDADLFSFAGLWEYWEHENEKIESCAIITTDANSVATPVHNRMPAILDPGQYNDWLMSGSRDLLKPYNGERTMICYPVTSKVNNPLNDGEELIRALQ
jgi:putative SOS response-associated peptidase YedK